MAQARDNQKQRLYNAENKVNADRRVIGYQRSPAVVIDIDVAVGKVIGTVTFSFPGYATAKAPIIFG